jgi:hypothetical protein
MTTRRGEGWRLEGEGRRLSQTTIDEFKSDWREAFTSLDEATLRAFFRKWGMPAPDDSAEFWGSVHKTIAVTPSLPLELRQYSTTWLQARGLSVPTWSSEDPEFLEAFKDL